MKPLKKSEPLSLVLAVLKLLGQCFDVKIAELPLNLWLIKLLAVDMSNFPEQGMNT